MISFPKRERAQRAAACVGVDAGKFSHTLVVRPQHQPDSRPFGFPTTRAGFDSALAFIRQQTAGAAAETILVGIEFAGNYGFTFAHYLAQLGFPIVSVLPAHTKRWKDVAHNQPLKTDAKDAGTITDLVAQGHFVGFPFLSPAYADLRYLVTARERLSLLRRGAITQLRTLIQVVFPEYEALFPLLTKKTPFAVLEPPYLLSIPKIAPVTAAIFLGSIGDPRAYESGAQILRVAGLSLVERSSGVLRGTKRISKRGRPLLRQAAYMFAVRSITRGGLFRTEYEALCQRNGGVKMKAVVAVMRSGLRLLYSIARDRRLFTAEPPTRRRAAA